MTIRERAGLAVLLLCLCPSQNREYLALLDLYRLPGR
jgi:hypothetical protein